MQTPLARYVPNYREHLIDVIVEIAPQKVQHFKAKKYLNSQKIVEEKEDGTLILSFTVTQEIEIIDMIKRWIPHIKVVSPLSLKEKVLEDIRQYLTV